MRLFLLVGLLIAPPLFGQLRWDTVEQIQNAKPEDKKAVAKFHFVNAGQSTIKIASVRTSCGCTTAALEKDQFAPGEAGDIEARFEFGSRSGHQEKTIAVTTSDQPNRPTYLRLVVDIPEPVVLQPEFVLWKIGEPVDAKK